MGAYMSEPIKDKQTEEGENSRIKYGATEMQGWRINQEDAHNCISDFEEQTSLFGVYDGHGGCDVSLYTAKHFPDFLKNQSAWKDGRFGQALEDAFLEFDRRILSDEAMAELKELAGKKSDDDKSDEEPGEDKRLLLEEAHLPLEEILMRYGLRFKKKSAGSSGKSKTVAGKFLSPNIRKGKFIR